MGEYFEEFVIRLNQNITAQLSDIASNFIKDHKFPQNDMVFNFLMTAQQSSILVSEILPIISLLRTSFDVRSPSGWIETEILSGDQLKALQLKFQEYNLDTDILSLNQTPINILDEYLVKQLPETINQANLKQILTQMIQTINILSQNQLKQTQQVKSSKNIDQSFQRIEKQVQQIQERVEQVTDAQQQINDNILHDIDARINNQLAVLIQQDNYKQMQQQVLVNMLPQLQDYVEQQIQQQKAKFCDYMQQMFDNYADSLEAITCELIKDAVKDDDQVNAKIECAKEKLQTIRQCIKLASSKEYIQQQLDLITSKYDKIYSLRDSATNQPEQKQDDQKELLIDESYKGHQKKPQSITGSQAGGQARTITASQLKFSQLQPSNSYQIIRTFQQVDPNELNYRINTIAQQTSRALEAINVTIKDINRKIDEVSRSRYSQLDQNQFQQLSQRILELDGRLQQFEEYRGE